MSAQADKIDDVVIGGGVIGCAVAASLAEKGRTVFLLEKHDRLGQETTERNSGVLHAGLYYKSGSLKENLCIRGNYLLQEYCQKKEVPLKLVGKFVVASTNSEVEALEKFWNKVDQLELGMVRVTSQDITKKEPLLHGQEAVYSSCTGIVDQAALVQALAIDAESAGAFVLTHCEVTSISPSSHGYVVETSRGPINASTVINAAGLSATKVAELAGVTAPETFFCRGDYYKVRGKPPFNSLVYPVKDPKNPGLGIHFTTDVGGDTRLGPDTTYIESLNYDPCEDKAEKFLKGGQKFLPQLTLEDLSWDYCGVRPKLRAPEESQEKDFYIKKENDHWVNLCGIESPGLTSSLAIGEFVSALV